MCPSEYSVLGTELSLGRLSVLTPPTAADSRPPLIYDFFGVRGVEDQEKEEPPIDATPIRSCDSDRLGLGVSTELTLLHDPWKIKKVLTPSDTDNLCRLLLPIKTVQDHILPYLSPLKLAQVETEWGARVKFWDHETESEHELALKRWSSSRSYVINDNWKQSFVERRSLRPGNEIGMYLDGSGERFIFRVLRQAPPSST